jgi:hypothetical protein
MNCLRVVNSTNRELYPNGNKMRIDNFEKTTITKAVQSIDKDASVWLFGSRTDDRKKGGKECF